jgi:hypothetical protein
MPAPLRPLAVSPEAVQSHFAGTGEALCAVATAAYPGEDEETAVTALLTRAVRAAQQTLERRSRVPFFVTRYCTRELATQENLTLGTDFEEWVQPFTYRQDRWLKQSARTDLGRPFVTSIEQFRLTLEGNARLLDVELSWLQLNREKGVVFILPSGLATAGLGYQGIHATGAWLRGAATGQIPLLVHVRFTAGLVSRTGSYADPDDESAFDPDADGFNTEWDQDLALEYQHQITLLAAASLMPSVGSYLEKGGLSISLDGLSEQVNSTLLQQRADNYEKGALAWAEAFRETTHGPVITTL